MLVYLAALTKHPAKGYANVQFSELNYFSPIPKTYSAWSEVEHRGSAKLRTHYHSAYPYNCFLKGHESRLTSLVLITQSFRSLYQTLKNYLLVAYYWNKWNKDWCELLVVPSNATSLCYSRLIYELLSSSDYPPVGY